MLQEVGRAVPVAEFVMAIGSRCPAPLGKPGSSDGGGMIVAISGVVVLGGQRWCL